MNIGLLTTIFFLVFGMVNAYSKSPLAKSGTVDLLEKSASFKTFKKETINCINSLDSSKCVDNYITESFMNYSRDALELLPKPREKSIAKEASDPRILEILRECLELGKMTQDPLSKNEFRLEYNKKVEYLDLKKQTQTDKFDMRCTLRNNFDSKWKFRAIYLLSN